MNGRPLFVAAYEGWDFPSPYIAAGDGSRYGATELILGNGATPFASLGSIQRKDGALFCLFAHPLIFSLLATALLLNQKIAPAAMKRTIASTMPIIEPVGIPCDDPATGAAAVFVLTPLLFTEPEDVGLGINDVRDVRGEEGMEAGAGGLEKGRELDDEVVTGAGTKTVTVGVDTTGFEGTGCRTELNVTVTGPGRLPESSRT
jgi:hypothetical protein